jgi:2-oxoglutarate ferredoxin oxidoreductase subunit alpha
MLDCEELDEVIIKFAGDSGDGIQLAGHQFARVSGLVGEQVKTMPDIPPEIRAPTGSLAGVSGLQVRTGAKPIYTVGNQADLLVALNPASLKVNLEKLKPNAIIIVNQDSFRKTANLTKAGFDSNPLEDDTLSRFRVFPIKINTLTKAAVRDLKLRPKQADRCKNFFALGLICWLFSRPMAPVQERINFKFEDQPQIAKGNLNALEAGWNWGETAELFLNPYCMLPNGSCSIKVVDGSGQEFITGNRAMAQGLKAAARLAGLPLFMGGYPITPATEILQELKKSKNGKVIAFQAEDEIAAIGAALGASFAGALGCTATSGPGLALKSEFINLAVMTELPLVIIDVQRGGPSTGLPTKTEQSDLMQALWGRNGESPVVVMAPRSPRDCFSLVVEASRIAIKYMTPVIILSDLALASGTDSWVPPEDDQLPEMAVQFADTRNTPRLFDRDTQSLARPWARPGTPGLEHIVGGLEKSSVDGRVSYEPDNHETMVKMRAAKIERVAQEIPTSEVLGDSDSELLIVGWGSTYGALMEAIELLTGEGVAVAGLNLRHLNPLPSDLGSVLRAYSNVLVVENNLGQLCRHLRSEYLVDARPLGKVQGMPFNANEIAHQARQMLGVHS